MSSAVWASSPKPVSLTATTLSANNPKRQDAILIHSLLRLTFTGAPARDGHGRPPGDCSGARGCPDWLRRRQAAQRPRCWRTAPSGLSVFSLRRLGGWLGRVFLCACGGKRDARSKKGDGEDTCSEMIQQTWLRRLDALLRDRVIVDVRSMRPLVTLQNKTPTRLNSGSSSTSLAFTSRIETCFALESRLGAQVGLPLCVGTHSALPCPETSGHLFC